MAVAGAKPKPAGQSRHRNPAAHDWTLVPDAPYADGPSLPRRAAGGWPAATKRWWGVVSTLPHCVLWTDADWQYAIDTAEVHARFVEGANATELRIREKLLGLTLDARRDLRIRYVAADAAALQDAPSAGQAGARVVNLDDFRDL